MTNRRRRNREEIDLTSDGEWLPSVDDCFVTTRRPKRRRKGKLPEYEWAMGETLATQKLPSYKEVMKEKIEEKNKLFNEARANILQEIKNIESQIEPLMIMKEYWLIELENLNKCFDSLINEYKNVIKNK